MLRKLQKVAEFSAALRKTAGIPKGLRDLATKAESTVSSGGRPSNAQYFAATRAAANRAGRESAKLRGSGDLSGASTLRSAGTGAREVSRDFQAMSAPKKSAPKAAPATTSPAQKPGVMSRIANHFKGQAGKHGVLPVAGSIAGGAMLMSSAAKAPSKYTQFKQGFRPENHQIGARVGE